MNKPHYTEGVCSDGAAILKDGLPMTISEILEALNASQPVPAGSVVVDAEKIADAILKSCDPETATRIALKVKISDDKERDLGGLNRDGLIGVIKAALDGGGV